MNALFLLLCFSLLINAQSNKVYKVIASRYSHDTLISKATGSAWDFNYNAAVYNYNNNIRLIVRCQNLKDASRPFVGGTSYLCSSQVTFNDSGFPFATPTSQILLGPNNTTEKCGLEDPRVAYLDGTYYMYYNAYDCDTAKISYAVSNNPITPGSWNRKGDIFPSYHWIKHSAPLFATPESDLVTHFLYWGESAIFGGISIATSSDAMHWTDTETFLLKPRNGFFDSHTVEPGPPPIRLASGDYLFIYNSARDGYPSARPGHYLQRNLGYAILDGSNPRYILQRGDQPILSPELKWEVGNSPEYLTPNTVYLTGLVAHPNGCPADVCTLVGPEFTENAECFFGAYTGADSVLGAVRIVASWITSDNATKTTFTTTTCPTPTKLINTANTTPTTSSTFNAESFTATIQSNSDKGISDTGITR